MRFHSWGATQPAMKWSEFVAAAPEIAGFAQDRMAETGLLLLGTLRADGWPRVSPIEPAIVDGHLIIGGTRGTRKTVDLMRDPRCVVNTVVADKGKGEEAKLIGIAREITDAESLERIAQDTIERYGFRPAPQTYHSFSMNITSAAYIVFHGDLTDTLRTWREGGEVVEVKRRWTPDGYKTIAAS